MRVSLKTAALNNREDLGQIDDFIYRWLGQDMPWMASFDSSGKLSHVVIRPEHHTRVAANARAMQLPRSIYLKSDQAEIFLGSSPNVDVIDSIPYVAEMKDAGRPITFVRGQRHQRIAL